MLCYDAWLRANPQAVLCHRRSLLQIIPACLGTAPISSALYKISDSKLCYFGSLKDGGAQSPLVLTGCTHRSGFLGRQESNALTAAQQQPAGHADVPRTALRGRSLCGGRGAGVPLTCCWPVRSPPGPARPRGAARGRSPRGGCRAPAWLDLW